MKDKKIFIRKIFILQLNLLGASCRCRAILTTVGILPRLFPPVLDIVDVGLSSFVTLSRMTRRASTGEPVLLVITVACGIIEPLSV
jgi:hypothetical protein